jgi:hypothetical protein
VKRGGEHRRAASEHRLIEERHFLHIDRNRRRLSVRAGRIDGDDRMRLLLVIERERQRAGEPPGLADDENGEPAGSAAIARPAVTSRSATPAAEATDACRRSADASVVALQR